MDITEFDRDETLTNFLSDYVDGKLDKAECRSFEEYLHNNDKEYEFAQKAARGKRALNRLAKHLKTNKRLKKSSLATADND